MKKEKKKPIPEDEAVRDEMGRITIPDKKHEKLVKAKKRKGRLRLP